MTSWTDLPFEIKSLILKNYIEQAEADSLQGDEEHFSTTQHLLHFQQGLKLLALAAVDMKAEIVLFLGQSLERCIAFHKNAIER